MPQERLCKHALPRVRLAGPAPQGPANIGLTESFGATGTCNEISGGNSSTPPAALGRPRRARGLRAHGPAHFLGIRWESMSRAIVSTRVSKLTSPVGMQIDSNANLAPRLRTCHSCNGQRMERRAQERCSGGDFG